MTQFVFEPRLEWCNDTEDSDSFMYAPTTEEICQHLHWPKEEGGEFHAVLCVRNIIWIGDSETSSSPAQMWSPCLFICLTCIDFYDPMVAINWLEKIDDPRKDLYYAMRFDD